MWGQRHSCCLPAMFRKHDKVVKLHINLACVKLLDAFGVSQSSYFLDVAACNYKKFCIALCFLALQILYIYWFSWTAKLQQLICNYNVHQFAWHDLCNINRYSVIMTSISLLHIKSLVLFCIVQIWDFCLLSIFLVCFAFYYFSCHFRYSDGYGEEFFLRLLSVMSKLATWLRSQ